MGRHHVRYISNPQTSTRLDLSKLTPNLQLRSLKLRSHFPGKFEGCWDVGSWGLKPSLEEVIVSNYYYDEHVLDVSCLHLKGFQHTKVCHSKSFVQNL